MERKKISDDYKVDVELLTVLNPDKNAPFFYISRMGVPVPFDEAWQSYLGGLFKLAPIPVFYKKFYQPAELLLAITSHSSFGKCRTDGLIVCWCGGGKEKQIPNFILHFHIYRSSLASIGSSRSSTASQYYII